MVVGEGCHQGGECRGGRWSDELELQVGGCRIDVSDDDITVIFPDRCGRVDVPVGSGSIEIEVFNPVFDRGVVVLPYTLLSRFCFFLGCEELAPMFRLLGRVFVYTSKTFFEEELGEVFTIDIESADESSYLVCSLDINLDVSLKAASIGKVMSLLSEGVRFLVCIAG